MVLSPTIAVEVSTNCGQSWSSVMTTTLDETGVPPAPQQWYIPVSDEYRWVTADLADYKDDEVIVRLAVTAGTNGNSIYVDEISFGEDFVSVPELSTESFNAYPNPFNNELNISLDLAADTDIAINIYDALGRVVESVISREYATGAHNVTVNTANLDNGIYVVKLENNGEVFSQEVMVKK